ncbi:MAG: thioredoxin domain-containing protein [Bryobacteraceae bacterium]
MPTHTNRLAHEKSPYLLQHAHNPVDWYPWGDEAFAKARAENKPIFLSIGYSTCHWCHVMERESFENDDTAAVLNRHFVPVKLDREERPDVDRIYMAYVQATTGSGGWPMSVFLTPSLQPFFGGTYFPPDSRYGRPGFKQLLEYLAQKWAGDEAKILETGDRTIEYLKQHVVWEAHPESTVDRKAFDRVFHYFRTSFDSRLGGFGAAPKFPRPSVHNFLLRYDGLSNMGEGLEMVAFTLREMAKGGIHDHLGGGFHRYSVDDRWFVPHFEKMLYDQAQLAISYLETYQLTSEEFFAATARDIFDYVLTDMTHPEGGFYSAEDADSVIDPADPHEKGEGAFYVWTAEELDRVLTPEEAAEVKRVYGVEPGGNVHEDPHNEFQGTNILYEAFPVKDAAAIASAKRKMLEARKKRVRPHLDDKVLTSWNGLMISAFAKGAQVLDDGRYLNAARRAAMFVLRNMYRPADGLLLRRWRDGEALIAGFLDDYACFGNALLDLYEASFETYFLEVAVQLGESMRERFEDGTDGGFYSTEAGDPHLIVRMKEDYDGAEASGNSMAAQLVVRLARFTGRDEFVESASRSLRAFAHRMNTQGVAMPQMMAVEMLHDSPPRQIVLAGPRDTPEMGALLRVMRSRFLPDAVTLMLATPEDRSVLARHSPALAAMTPVEGKPAAYVCENFTCQLPVTEPEKLAELLH